VGWGHIKGNLYSEEELYASPVQPSPTQPELMFGGPKWERFFQDNHPDSDINSLERRLSDISHLRPNNTIISESQFRIRCPELDWKSAGPAQSAWYEFIENEIKRMQDWNNCIRWPNGPLVIQLLQDEVSFQRKLDGLENPSIPNAASFNDATHS